MNLRTGRGFQKMLIAGLALFLVQLACGGVAPTDPLIPVSLNNMASQFDPLLTGLQVIPIGGLRPPLITLILPDSVSGLGSIGSVGLGAVDSTGVEATEPSFKIRLYRMQLRGCGKEPLRGDLLAETTVDFGGTWNIQYSFESGEVIGATQVSEGKESGLSNLIVNLGENSFMNLDKESEIQQIEYDVSQPLLLTGSSFPGACVVLQNQDMEYGRVGSVTVPEAGVQKGKWAISVQLQEGENRYKIYVEGWEETEKEFVLRGFSPHMLWPYREKNENGDDIGPDYDIPVTGFFGRNDYYVVHKYGFHDGLDIGGREGTSAYAVADGEVFFVQFSNVVGCGGNSIYIDHGGWGSFYLHLSKITIDPSNSGKSMIYDHPIRVVAGQEIGATGTSGLSGKQYHLHVSAFRWVKGTRQLSFNIGKSYEKDCYIKDLKFNPWPVSRFGILYNLNPLADRSLEIMAYAASGKTTPAHDVISTDRLQNCVSRFNYWDIDWGQVLIKEYGPSDVIGDAVGTQFDLKGKDEKCAIP